jgi:hypothetical protein
LPITALRETPIAAAIWLQVMPLSTQLRSCSMRSDVQVAVDVALEGAMLFGAGPTIAESTAGAVGAIGGIAGDEVGIDGAIDGDMETASLYCRGRTGPPTGRWPRAAGDRETQTSKRKSVRGLRADPEKEAPDVTPVAAGPPKKSAPPNNYAAFTEPHPASRMANPPLEWRPYAATRSGPLLVAVEREPSPNPSVARFDSPAKS